jgi:hypothetical protein
MVLQPGMVEWEVHSAPTRGLPLMVFIIFGHRFIAVPMLVIPRRKDNPSNKYPPSEIALIPRLYAGTNDQAMRNECGN